MICADWAATSPRLAPGVAEAVNRYLEHPCSPGHSTSAAAFAAGREVWKTRQNLAAFFGFSTPERVVFTSGITESLNTAIASLIREEDHVITTIWEHNAVLRPLIRTGADLSRTDGSLEQIAAARKENTRAVVLTHQSNVTGQILDLEAIGAWCQEHGILLIVDSAQSAGILRIDMARMHIDVLAVTGHKGLQALQGTGALLVRPGLEMEPLKTGGTGIHSFEPDMPAAWPEHMEAGTLNMPGIISLQATMQALPEEKRQEKEAKIRHLSHLLETGIRAMDRITLYRDPDTECLGIFSINIEGKDPAWTGEYLERHGGICTRTGAHCAPEAMKHFGISSCVRLSIGADTTEEEIQSILSTLQEAACA